MQKDFQDWRSNFISHWNHFNVMLCKVCNVGFHDNIKFDELITSIKFQNLKCRNLINFSDVSFLCNTCNFKTNSNYNLRSHEMVHSGSKEYTCPKCFHIFPSKSNLPNHTDREHDNNVPNVIKYFFRKKREKGSKFSCRKIFWWVKYKLGIFLSHSVTYLIFVLFGTPPCFLGCKKYAKCVNLQQKLPHEKTA